MHRCAHSPPSPPPHKRTQKHACMYNAHTKMHTCTHVQCITAYTHPLKHIRLHTPPFNTHAHTHVHPHMHMHTFTHTCTHAHMHTHTHTHTHTCPPHHHHTHTNTHAPALSARGQYGSAAHTRGTSAWLPSAAQPSGCGPCASSALVSGCWAGRSARDRRPGGGSGREGRADVGQLAVGGLEGAAAGVGVGPQPGLGFLCRYMTPLNQVNI